MDNRLSIEKECTKRVFDDTIDCIEHIIEATGGYKVDRPASRPTKKKYRYKKKK